MTLEVPVSGLLVPNANLRFLFPQHTTLLSYKDQQGEGYGDASSSFKILRLCPCTFHLSPCPALFVADLECLASY